APGLARAQAAARGSLVAAGRAALVVEPVADEPDAGAGRGSRRPGGGARRLLRARRVAHGARADGDGDRSGERPFAAPGEPAVAGRRERRPAPGQAVVWRTSGFRAGGRLRG